MSVLLERTAVDMETNVGLPRLQDLPPRLALLSNGQYAVMITDAGAGASVWRGLDVTRWRDDPTTQCWGQFAYVRDVASGRIWSTSRQPTCTPADECDATFHPHAAEFRRIDGDLDTRWTVFVPPGADAELRVATFVNRGTRARDVEVTSYAEVCLNHRRADQAHPAFAKLFVETSFDVPTGALLARRRPRGANEKPLWAVHAMVGGEPQSGPLEYETDRARFLGRGRTPTHPQALDDGTKLSCTTGPVLDAVFSLRRRLRLAPGASVRVAFVTGAADTRDAAVALVQRFEDLAAVDAALDAAQSAAVRELQESVWTPEDVLQFQQLAAAVVFPGPDFRRPEAVLTNRLGQSGLWPHAISGDLPIVLVQIADDDDVSLLQELIQWRLFGRRRGLDVDLVALDERGAEAAAELKQELEAGPHQDLVAKPGGVFIVDGSNIPPDDATLLAATARVVLGGGSGFPTARPGERPGGALAQATLTPSQPIVPTAPNPVPIPADLLFWNSLGGFTPDGREYVIVVEDDPAPRLPPAPWINVLANPLFGCLAGEAGLGYSWAGNSQTNRLTPWANDPIADKPAEVVYFRDEETGEVWTPTPSPVGAGARVVVSHGQGYTRYTRRSHGLRQEMLVFVPPDDPVKVVRLTVKNDGDRPRRITATYFAEWVLGTARDQTAPHLVTEFDAASNLILATNAWAGDFAGKTAFLAAAPFPRSATGDRTEFLGRQGSQSAPAALGRSDLANRFGACLDPCAALMSEATVAPGATAEFQFVLGQADDAGRVRDLAAAYTDPKAVAASFVETVARWDDLLGQVQVETPDPGMNVMLNRWLHYQAIACRLWARSALYQSGGAYGFRDQLQDVMALVHGAPAEARAHILRAAARQFEEGDVQHWWHPPSGAGVRTRITDDLYFLPLVVHHYVTTTGDAALLDEEVSYLAAPELLDHQEEVFNAPGAGAQVGSIYDHCVRALERGLRLGAHGLPLMGTGDWNDGMNKVGAEGQGESVFNGWFFVAVLRAFAELAAQHGDASRSAWCIEQAESLRSSIEENAWDGGWYRRAYFDDGTPLGSAQNDECQIDEIPQAWAVISGAADPVRARTAMGAVYRRLVRTDDKLIKLFDPPFDDGPLQPGYIKGYVPGIRENGGQYTHAATWVALAAALQGDGDRAVELWNLINPVYHADSPEAVARYKVEPYVVCADVYGAPPHVGRGGWTWYTGSASWLYRVAIESILGLKRTGDMLRIEPCIPRGWKSFVINYRYGGATYHIQVKNPAAADRGVRTIRLDGVLVQEGRIPLHPGRALHEVEVCLG